jgi:hypothetical protein
MASVLNHYGIKVEQDWEDMKCLTGPTNAVLTSRPSNSIHPVYHLGDRALVVWPGLTVLRQHKLGPASTAAVGSFHRGLADGDRSLDLYMLQPLVCKGRRET